MKISPIFMVAALSGVAITFAAPIPNPMPLGGLGRVLGKCFGCVDGSKAVRESISRTSELTERPRAWYERPALPQYSFERPSSPNTHSPHQKDSPGHLSPIRPEQGALREPLTLKSQGSKGQSVPLTQMRPGVAPRARYPEVFPDAYTDLALTSSPRSSPGHHAPQDSLHPPQESAGHGPHGMIPLAYYFDMILANGEKDNIHPAPAPSVSAGRQSESIRHQPAPAAQSNHGWSSSDGHGHGWSSSGGHGHDSSGGDYGGFF
ncbi:uncharacterized protein UTRI_10311 [Ustilago trichophora]|uniref:Uncharacterized protein n=1 Tax=Ustilago trichophora TaxID=86804 RepID=A0A5C3ENS1_9BASI|nr:uncharacterized protein UTRI_10311 [Ustilago trichophora]